MGEKLEVDNLFVVFDDGTWVPFEGFKPADIVYIDEMDQELYNSLPKEGTIDLRFDMKRRDHRKMLKCLKKQSNSIGRRVRHYQRQKERARRRALKERKGTT